MITKRGYLAWLGSALIVVSCTAAGGQRDRVGDGTFKAGRDIKAGTWHTDNPGPHTQTVQCQWLVTLGSNTGTVVLRSHDTAEKPQDVYIPAGKVFSTANCGTWHWVAERNILPTPD